MHYYLAKLGAMFFSLSPIDSLTPTYSTRGIHEYEPFFPRGSYHRNPLSHASNKKFEPIKDLRALQMTSNDDTDAINVDLVNDMKSNENGENELNEEYEEAYENELALLDELFWNVQISDDDATLFKTKPDTEIIDPNNDYGQNFSSEISNYNGENMLQIGTNDTTKEWNGTVSNTTKLLSIDDLKKSPMDILKLAPASQIAYFYLQSLGLSEETMWKITTDAGSILGLTVPNLKNKVDFLQSKLGLTDDDMKQILMRQPTVLQMSVENNLKPTIQFLEKELLSIEPISDGVESTNDIVINLNSALKVMIVEYPSILCYSIQNLRKKLNFFRTALKLTPTERLMILEQNPSLLTLSVEANLKPKIQFLQHEVQLSIEDLRTICVQNPKILMYSLHPKLFEVIISYFIMRLHMEVPNHISKVLTSFPQILDYSLEYHLLPITLYFIEDLGFQSVEFRTMLLRYPKLMTHSLDKIEYVTEFLSEELSLGRHSRLDESQLGQESKKYIEDYSLKRVLLQAPQIVGLDMENNVCSKLHFLETELDLDLCNDNGNDTRKLIIGMPTLLLCSIEKNLRPKVQYLKSKFGTIGTRDLVLRQPALLGYSLEKRIQPRLERIIKEQCDLRKITTAMTLSSKKFDEWIVKNKGQYRKEVNSQNFDLRETINIGNEEKISGLGNFSLKETKADEANESKQIERIKLNGRVVHWNRTRKLPSQKEIDS